MNLTPIFFGAPPLSFHQVFYVAISSPVFVSEVCFNPRSPVFFIGHFPEKRTCQGDHENGWILAVLPFATPVLTPASISPIWKILGSSVVLI